MQLDDIPLPARPARAGERPLTVSLALGSGGARGLAHIGVIGWLVDHGYRIASIAGSSMGALIGGIYAAGRLDAYSEWVSALERGQVLRLLDPSFGSGGLFKGERIMAMLRELVGDHVIEALEVPFTAVATDLASGEEVWLREGNLFDAIRASIATPLIFTPFQHGARMLGDGALVNPLPIAPMLLERADLMVAVDLGAAAQEQSSAASIQVDAAFVRRVREFLEARLERASDESVRRITARALASVAASPRALPAPVRSPDITVPIPCNACGPHEFWRALELIELGRQRAAQAFAAAPQPAAVPAPRLRRAAPPAPPARAHDSLRDDR